MVLFKCLAFSPSPWLLAQCLLLGVAAADRRWTEPNIKTEHSYEDQGALAPLSSTINSNFLQTDSNRLNWNEWRGIGYSAPASTQGGKRATRRVFIKGVIAVVALAAALAILRCIPGIGDGGATWRSLAIGGGDDSEGGCDGSEDDGSEPHEGSDPSESEEKTKQRASDVLQSLTMLTSTATRPLKNFDPTHRAHAANLLATHILREAALVYNLLGDDLAGEKKSLEAAIDRFLDYCFRTNHKKKSGGQLYQRLKKLLAANKDIHANPPGNGSSLAPTKREQVLRELLGVQMEGVAIAMKEFRSLPRIPITQLLPEEAMTGIASRLSSLFFARRLQMYREPCHIAVLDGLRSRYPRLQFFCRRELEEAHKATLGPLLEDQIAELHLALTRPGGTRQAIVVADQATTCEGASGFSADESDEAFVRVRSSPTVARVATADASASGSTAADSVGSSATVSPIHSQTPQARPLESVQGAPLSSLSSQTESVRHPSSDAAHSMAPGAGRSARVFYGAPVGEPIIGAVSSEAGGPRRPFPTTPQDGPARGTGLSPEDQTVYSLFREQASGRTLALFEGVAGGPTSRVESSASTPGQHRSTRPFYGVPLGEPATQQDSTTLSPVEGSPDVLPKTDSGK